MLLKLVGLGFIVLVFLGLGLSGTLNAAFLGYHKIASNPAVQQLETKTTAIKNAAAFQIHSIEKNGLNPAS